ncbi:hypothetical protein MFFC18_37470 [Mariniblastus fucicola]|uniref:Signal peptide prediction n=2 Tax=Mariniblastus fucicola TaxID=980251 RepID=A0A5B9PNK7_9BACT|nr:hypothetical protein MFFC18_37470 [Mariniblastus fucicola]
MAPYVYIPKKFKLRVLGTHVTLQEEIRVQAEKDLGIEIQFQPGGSAEVLHQASTRPESFDLYEQWSNSIKVLWQARSIQQIDARRIRYWDEINGISKVGRLTKNSKLGAGDAPHKMVYVQPDQSLGARPGNNISFLPYVHNVDSFGYDTEFVKQGQPYQTESWGWLLDEQFHGKVALVNAPSIGIFDAALAVEAAGLMKFEDIGSLTHAEIDRLFEILIGFRRKGHFRGAWSSVPQSVDMMRDREVHLESMFSPAVYSLRSEGVDCVYASPKEGFRAWHGVMCLSSRTNGAKQDAAYEFMNWWLSGWPGAYIARQGYYISNPRRARQHLSQSEWDYWYEGKPATEDLLGTNNSVVAKKGRTRDGGSYQRRFDNIAVWNTVMPTYEYSLRAWQSFLAAT